MSFVDIKKAYFNGIPNRKLQLFLPREMGQEPRSVARLKMCVYGTRDDGLLGEEVYSQVMCQMGFVNGDRESVLL